MRQSNQEQYPDSTHQIDLIKLANSLKKNRWFIFGFTGITPLIALVYVLSLPPQPYITTMSFITPSESSVLSLNKLLKNETKETIFTRFLNKLLLKEFQEKVFYENDYLAALNLENGTINDVEENVLGFLSSISVVKPIVSKDNEKLKIILEKPYSISLEGSNAEIISRFLNDLVVSANNETVNDLINISNQKSDIRLDEISIEREMLLTSAQNERLNQIYRLTYAAKLAGSLGIIENNLDTIIETNVNNEDFDLPEWYLFGEKALLEKIEILKARTNDDPFILELVNLNQEETYLINMLDLAKIKLQSTPLKSSGDINAMQLTHYVQSHQLPSNNNTRIVVFALIFGFILSIFLALLINLFKESETEPTTKTSR